MFNASEYNSDLLLAHSECQSASVHINYLSIRRDDLNFADRLYIWSAISRYVLIERQRLFEILVSATATVGKFG
jgi:hypothetical protein